MSVPERLVDAVAGVLVGFDYDTPEDADPTADALAVLDAIARAATPADMEALCPQAVAEIRAEALRGAVTELGASRALAPPNDDYERGFDDAREDSYRRLTRYGEGCRPPYDIDVPGVGPIRLVPTHICSGGWTRPGVLGGWTCPCECHGEERT